MYVMVMYDIVSNSARRKVSIKCLDLGLRRVQKSVFVGHASAAQRERMVALLEEVLGEEVGLIHIIPLHRDNMEGLKEIYNPGEVVQDDEAVEEQEVSCAG